MCHGAVSVLYSNNEPFSSALEQGSESLPAAELLFCSSSCTIFSPLIVIWLLRAHGGDGAPPPGAAGTQPPAALPSPCTQPEENEEIMKERDLWCLMKIMIIMAMIIVLLVQSYNDCVDFTHGFLDTSDILKNSRLWLSLRLKAVFIMMWNSILIRRGFVYFPWWIIKSKKNNGKLGVNNVFEFPKASCI